MPFNTAYRLTFKTAQWASGVNTYGNVLMYVDIFDTYTEVQTGGQAYTTITNGGEVVCKISTINNEEEIYGQVVCGKRCDISFYSTSSINMSTFATGQDSRWLVTVTDADSFIHFKGYLVQDDIREPFLPLPNLVELTANDGLASLKDKPLEIENPIVFNAPIEVVFYNTAFYLTLANPAEWFGYFAEGGKFTIEGTNLNDGDYTIALRSSDATTIIIYPTVAPITEAIITATLKLHRKFEHQYYTLIDWASQCLAKTGIKANIYVMNALVEVNALNVPHFQSCFEWTKSFEGSQVGEFLTAHEILERICTRCRVSQFNGEWWITRTDDYEYENILQTYYKYNSGGEFKEKLLYQNLRKNIGKNEKIILSQEATEVTLVRPKKFVKETAAYDYPKEIIDNIDFERGDLLPLGTPTVKTYSIHDWTLGAGTGSKPITTPATATGEAYIKREFINDYETERYLHLASPTTSQNMWVKSNPIPIGVKDKAQISVDFRINGNIAGGNLIHLMYVVLVGEDGISYQFGDNTLGGGYKWYNLNTNNYQNETGIRFGWDSSQVDETKYQTLSGEILPAPVAGNLFIYLVAYGTSTFVNEKYIEYQNLSFDYLPFINGSYQKYSGQSYKVAQRGFYRATFDEDVNVSSLPRKLFQGALHRINKVWQNAESHYYGSVTFTTNEFVITGNYMTTFTIGQKLFITTKGVVTVHKLTYVVNTTTVMVLEEFEPITQVAEVFSMVVSLVGNFYNNQQNPLHLPEHLHPFGEIQAYDVWNQHNRVLRVIDATMQGTTGTSVGGTVNPIGIVHLFEFMDISPHTRPKYFLCLGYEMDMYLGEWTGVFKEVFDFGVEKDYVTDIEFKYISDR